MKTYSAWIAGLGNFTVRAKNTSNATKNVARQARAVMIRRRLNGMAPQYTVREVTA